MKRSWIIILAAAAGFGILFWFAWPKETVDYHKRGWLFAAEHTTGCRIKPPTRLETIREQLTRLLRPRVDYNQRMYEHEAALIRLGYLTNRDFLVTNQILTLDFNSNFFGKIHEAFGTSGESI